MRNNWSRPLFLAPLLPLFTHRQIVWGQWYTSHWTQNLHLKKISAIQDTKGGMNKKTKKASSLCATILWQRGKTNKFEENIFDHSALHCSNCDVSMGWAAGKDWSNPSSSLQFLVRCAAWFLIHYTQSILFRWHSSSSSRIYWTLNAFNFLQPLLNLMIWGHIAQQVFKGIT